MEHLKDYLEMIESLPKELQDGFIQLLVLDIEAENDSNKLEERTKNFVESAEKQKNVAEEERDSEYQAIQGGYSKAVSNADDKIRLSSQMHDKLGRYMNLLDQQINKLKMDLEADEPGSTELLEKRFQEKLGLGEKECEKDSRLRKKIKPHSGNGASFVAQSGPVRGMPFVGASSSSGGADDGITATTSSGGPRSKQTKKNKSRKCQKQAFVQPQTVLQIKEGPIIMPMESSADLLTVKPDEPRYCICGNVSYGDMVACDNPECPTEWFHYGCVEITSAPTGKWYCPTCKAQRKL